MKTPKLLPWLARRAGISDARAEELWADAIRYGTAKAGWVGTPDYWRLVNEKLLELIEAEHQASCRPQITPSIRIQTRIGSLPLMAWEAIYRAQCQLWKNNSRFMHHAH